METNGKAVIGNMHMGFEWKNDVRLQSCLCTTFLMLCGPTSMNQRGSFSASTYYRRKQLKPCGFNMRWQEGVTSNNLGSVSVMNNRKVKCYSNECEVKPRVT